MARTASQKMRQSCISVPEIQRNAEAAGLVARLSHVFLFAALEIMGNAGSSAKGGGT